MWLTQFTITSIYEIIAEFVLTPLAYYYSKLIHMVRHKDKVFHHFQGQLYKSLYYQ